jgi:hypothetical protein
MESMTIAQLKEVAQQKGMTVTSKMKKAEIIEMLKSGNKPEKVGTRYPGEY